MPESVDLKQIIGAGIVHAAGVVDRRTGREVNRKLDPAVRSGIDLGSPGSEDSIEDAGKG